MMVVGKVVIVTGSTGGIGSSIARLLASEGARVVLTARRVEALAKLQASISAETGRPESVHVEAGDVTEEADVATIFSNVAQKHGRVDILVNNAGISGPGGIEMEAAEFRRILDVNVVGCFLCAQAAFRHGVERIINVGSISAMAPRPDSTAYTTSKFALDGLTRSLALDGRKRGIACGVIHPGNVASDLLSPEEFEHRRQTEGLLEADHVARSVLLMASMPPEANVLELCVVPTTQPLVGRG